MLILILSMLYHGDNSNSHSPAREVHRKRTESEWICTRCRLPAEGAYCVRCGQPYELPNRK